VVAVLISLSACGDAKPPAPAPTNVATPPPAPTPPSPPASANPGLLDPGKANAKAPATFQVRFETTKGEFVVKASRSWAPLGAGRFYNLVKVGYYDDVAFHRVVDGKLAQFGVSGYPGANLAWKDARIRDEPARKSNARGRVAFATSGRDERVSHVFVNLADNTEFDTLGFSPFGEVVRGMDVVDRLHADYGEAAPRGRGPDPGRIRTLGNPYLREGFPELDYVNRATLVDGG